MEVNEVFLLEETYKDGDPEVIGAYDSMRAMIKGLANRIADDCIADVFGVNGKVSGKALIKAIKETARSCASMIPAILHCDFADEECRRGRTVYGYRQLPVEGEAGSDDDEVVIHQDRDDEDEEDD